MNNQEYEIKIVLSGLKEKDFKELKKFCDSNPFISLCNVHGLGGEENVIISIIYEEFKNISVPEIIINCVVSELFLFLGKFLLSNTYILVLNGKKYVGLRINELKKRIHSVLTKNNPKPVDLFAILGDFINKNNKDFNQLIVLKRESLLDEKFLHIDLRDNQIYFDQKLFVYLSSYFFGSSKLSHLYKLSHDLILTGYIDEATDVNDKLSIEWRRIEDRMKFFIKTNPFWIINQIAIGILHELGHHQMLYRPEDFTKEREYLHGIAKNAAEKMLSNLGIIQMAEFDRKSLMNPSDKGAFADIFTIALPLIGECASSIIDDVLTNKEFVDELQADLFSFKWMLNTATLFKSNKVTAEILASLIGNSNYVVACEILNAYSYNPVNSSATERLAMGTYNHIKNNLRAAVRNAIALPYIEDLKNDKEAYASYRNLISSPFIENNCTLDVDFLTYTDRFYTVTRNGHNVASNECKRERLERQISCFDDNILNLLRDSIQDFIINH